MSPRVPIRLLTGVLLIAALANLAASATNGQPLLTVLSALTASGLVALWFYLSLSAATTSVADHSTDSRSQSPSAGVKAGLTPGQPARRLHDIASAVKTVAGMGIVVGSIIALRTIIALEALHVEALQ